MKKLEYLFTKKDLRRLIIPLIFEQALAITVGMADTMMVSSAGEAAVSGVSLVDMINVLIFNVLAALATGGAVVTSQNIGARKSDEACESAKQLLYTVIMGGVAIGILSIVFRRPLLRLFFGSIERDVMNDALTYLWISAVSYPFLAVYNACAALFRSMGNSRMTLRISLIINVINIAGNALCIFVLNMGVAGVAVPSLVSRAVGAIILYVLLRDPARLVHFSQGRLRLNFRVIKKILYIGIPSGVENGIFQLGRVLVVSIISGFGTVQIAANGVANNLDSMGIIVGQAMNLAMITVIGQCVGANDERQIRYYTKKLTGTAYIGEISVIVVIFAFLKPLLGLYGLSGETTELAALLVWIHNGSAMVLWPLSFVLPNMLKACNDVRYTMVVSVFSMFVFRVGFSYFLGVRMGMGAVGVWIAMVLDWIFRTIMFLARYFSGKWKKLCLIDVKEKDSVSMKAV